MVDPWLVASARAVTLKLNAPRRAAIALVTDAPWEGPTSAGFTARKDGDAIRLYYRGSVGGSDTQSISSPASRKAATGSPLRDPIVDSSRSTVRPGTTSFGRGANPPHFAPFIDENPNVRPDERYQALGGLKERG